MTPRHRPHLLRGALARVAVTGTASLATIIAVAPVAVAVPGDEIAPAESSETGPVEDETPPDTPTDTDPPVDDPAGEDEPVEETPSTDEAPPSEESADETPATSSAEVAPIEIIDGDDEEEDGEFEFDFGLQKYRVGVQVADGSYAPDASTVGSTIQVTISGEVDFGGVIPIPLPPTAGSFTCTTDASTVEEDSTASYCLGEEPFIDPMTAAPGGAVARSVSQSQGPIPVEQAFTLLPGQTATITQLTAGDGLIKSPATSVIGPCTPALPIPLCTVGDPIDGIEPVSTTVLFDNFGPPPIAKDDKITATAGDPTTIKVTKNDDTVNGAPIESVSIISGPLNGTAQVSGNNIVYTSDDDFDGTDTLDYRLTTANGSDTATVTIAVEPDGILPDTGAPDNSLLGYGALMLAGGAWLLARGRREDALVD